MKDIEKIAKEYDSNLEKQIKINNSIEACNQYTKKVSAQNEEIMQMNDDIDLKKKDLEDAKEDIEIYTTEKEKLSGQKHLYEIASSLKI